MRIAQRARLVPHICALFLVFSMVASIVPAYGQSRQTVGLELALLVDVSASVNEQEYRLQIDGLADAVRSPAVLEAVLASGGIVVCVIQWAQQTLQYKSVDWTHLDGKADVLNFAIQIESMNRPAPAGQTAIGDALAVASNEIQTNNYSGLRRVIDLSGDGRSNDGRLLRQAREKVIEHDITINGLAILNEIPDLKAYFRSQLIGGPGAFVMTAQDYTDFSRAIGKKLEREIRPTPVAGNTTPTRLASSETVNSQLSKSSAKPITK